MIKDLDFSRSYFVRYGAQGPENSFLIRYTAAAAAAAAEAARPFSLLFQLEASVGALEPLALLY